LKANLQELHIIAKRLIGFQNNVSFVSFGYLKQRNKWMKNFENSNENR
jgi:hypothetical protein